MLRYRGSNLIRAGFIGVVLIILVIAVGLQPERLMQWATVAAYQALFAEAGGLAAGNDVTVSGIKVGTVSSIELDNGDALVGFHHQRQVRARLGNHRAHPHRNAARRAGTGPGVRGQRHAATRIDVIPAIAHVVAVLVDRRGQ